MASPKPPSDGLSAAEVESQLGALSPGDWGRALSMARLLSAGIGCLDPDDLLSEAMTKLLAGERVWRRGVPPLVTLKVAMRGVASNARKKEVEAPIDRFVTVTEGTAEDFKEGQISAQAVDSRTPDAISDSRRQLALIEKAVAGDKDVEQVLTAWILGLRGTEAIVETGLDSKRYDAARQRLLRKLQPVADARKER